MGRRKPNCFNIDDVLTMAQDYGVADNPLFLQTFENYKTIQETIDIIRESISGDNVTVTKKYGAKAENEYMHPAIKELPKYIDASNKTLDKMLDIIDRLGVVAKPDELLEYIK